MESTIRQQISGSQWARLAGQVWKCDDGTTKTGAELVRRLLSLGTLAFPIDTVARSPVGAIVRAGISTWERID
jgi:hypothetical protein